MLQRDWGRWKGKGLTKVLKYAIIQLQNKKAKKAFLQLNIFKKRGRETLLILTVNNSRGIFSHGYLFIHRWQWQTPPDLPLLRGGNSPPY